MEDWMDRQDPENGDTEVVRLPELSIQFLADLKA